MRTISMLELLVAKARSQSETAGMAADKSMNELVRQLKERGIKVRSSDVSTRSTDAEIVIFANTRFELVIQVSDDSKYEVQIWDVQQQKLDGAGFTKSVDKVMKDLKKYASQIKKSMGEKKGPKVVTTQSKTPPSSYISGKIRFEDVFAAVSGRGKAAEWVVYIKVDGTPKAVSYMGSGYKQNPIYKKAKVAADKMVAGIKAGDVRIEKLNSGGYSAIHSGDPENRDPPVVAPAVEPKEVKWPAFNASATKARNWIVKTIGGKPVKLVGNTQTFKLGHRLTVKQAMRLVNLAREATGVKVSKTKGAINTVQVQHSDINMYIDLQTGNVVIYGDPTSRPK